MKRKKSYRWFALLYGNGAPLTVERLRSDVVDEYAMYDGTREQKKMRVVPCLITLPARSSTTRGRK